MNSPVVGHGNEEDDFIGDEDDEVFINEGDIIQEIPIDEEELPEADDDDEASDAEAYDGPDDSLHTFTGHTGELYTAACSPRDPTLVATGGGDDKGFLWGIGQGDWAFELQGHTDSVSSVSFSTDGQLLASGSFDGCVKLWDVSSKSLRGTLEGPGGSIEFVRWHPRGHWVLAGSEDCSAWLWNADKDDVYINMFGHTSGVTCGDFTPDGVGEPNQQAVGMFTYNLTHAGEGRTICTGSDDGTMRIWNPKDGKTIHLVQGYPYHTQGLTCLTISSDSTLALTGSKDASAHIVNIGTGKVVGSLKDHSDSVECVAFSPSFPWVVTGGLDMKLIIWDIQHFSPRCTCMHEEGVTCLKWLGASKYLATGAVDGKIKIWDSLSGDCVKTFSGHIDAIQSLAVSANGEFLVSASIDHTARAFEIAEFK